MFEEDAEEWVKENMDCCITDNSVNQPIPYFSEEERCCAKSAFKDGAEFGYNKANEWHYVKDGEYPKEKGNYLVAWKRTHHVEEYGKWGFDVDLFNADEGYFEGVGDYVIAWKEIVLPELPKESE